MAWYHAAKRQDGRYDYVCTNGAGTFPLGYCAPLTEASPEHIEQIWFGKERYEAYMAPRRDVSDQFHSDGHATEEEAIECYRQYQLDFELKFVDGPTNPDSLHKCCAVADGGVCGKFTAGYGCIGNSFTKDFWLCEHHRTRMAVEILTRPKPEKKRKVSVPLPPYPAALKDLAQDDYGSPLVCSGCGHSAASEPFPGRPSGERPCGFCVRNVHRELQASEHLSECSGTVEDKSGKTCIACRHPAHGVWYDGSKAVKVPMDCYRSVDMVKQQSVWQGAKPGDMIIT